MTSQVTSFITWHRPCTQAGVTNPNPKPDDEQRRQMPDETPEETLNRISGVPKTAAEQQADSERLERDREEATRASVTPQPTRLLDDTAPAQPGHVVQPGQPTQSAEPNQPTTQPHVEAERQPKKP